jgi:hypothetical protein
MSRDNRSVGGQTGSFPHSYPPSSNTTQDSPIGTRCVDLFPIQPQNTTLKDYGQRLGLGRQILGIGRHRIGCRWKMRGFRDCYMTSRLGEGRERDIRLTRRGIVLLEILNQGRLSARRVPDWLETEFREIPGLLFPMYVEAYSSWCWSRFSAVRPKHHLASSRKRLKY